MFIPNRKCIIKRKTKNVDLFGQITYTSGTTIPFALVRFDTKTEDTTVRADSSATRGNTKEYVASGRILVKASVAPVFGDLIVSDGLTFRIKGIEPRYNVMGKLDHYQLELEKFTLGTV